VVTGVDAHVLPRMRQRLLRVIATPLPAIATRLGVPARDARFNVGVKMPALIINGRECVVPGLTVVNFRDDPRLALRIGQPDGSNDGKTRAGNAWIRLVVLHTTKGIPGGADKRSQDIRPGLGPSTDAGVRIARFWSTDPKSSGAHVVVDHDGVVCQLADLQLVSAYHAGHKLVNADSVGIEIFQGSGAELYEDQLDAAATLVDALTLHLGIQRQIPDRYRGALDRFDLRDSVGVVGHRDVSDNRGPGDPGDAIFDVLARRGYERFDFAAGKDLAAWRERQHELGVTADGIPGPKTSSALEARGHDGGLWVCAPRAEPAPKPPMPNVVAPVLDGLLPMWIAVLGSEEKVRAEVAAWVSRLRG